jgi:hypothetical protein
MGESHKPTVKDIAKKAGVSVATVSRVVNGNPSPCAGSVLEVVMAMKYLRNQHAVELGRSNAGLSRRRLQGASSAKQSSRSLTKDDPTAVPVKLPDARVRMLEAENAKLKRIISVLRAEIRQGEGVGESSRSD